MTERMKVVVDDDELKALIPLLDELIIKKTELLGAQLPTGLDEIAGAAAATKEETEATIINLNAGLDDIQAQAQFTEAYVETIVDRITLRILTAEQAASFVSTDALMKLFAVEKQTKTLQERVRDLPNVDRATRMILLRIPGLREVLRLLYIIKMEERTLRLGQVVATAKAAEVDIGATITKLSGGLAVVEAEAMVVEVSVQATINRLTAEIAAAETRAATSIASIRGPVTAAITLLIYAIMVNQWLQSRQDRMEARLNAMKREMDQRYITIEEALRGYDGRPEKYRATVPP